MTLKSITSALKHTDNRPIRKKALTSALVAGCYYSDSSNYYHFWCDAIADIWMFIHSGKKLSQIQNIIMPYSGSPWQKEILNLLAIPEKSVVGLHEFTECRVNQAFFCFRPKGGRAGSPWLHKALQSIAQPEKYTNNRMPRKIYVARFNAKRRRLLNEDTAIYLMKKFAYQIIDCSNLTVKEQIEFFRNASHVVGPHGAGLTNIAWCKPQTKVLDLMPLDHANPCFFDLASQGSLEYHVFPTQAAEDFRNPLDCPVYINCEELERFMIANSFC